MLESANFLPEDHSDRKSQGLIYRDAALAETPATHVLIIGVAAYQSVKFKKPLNTATISARRLADWFLQRGTPGFQNDDHALGSVALLLSETTQISAAAEANYAGSSVPRATYLQTVAAVSGWVQRINSNKDNLAVLYIASHGESFLNRTAFILEDYDTKGEMLVTFGMSDIDQFIGALEQAKPVRQLLLFDCCRAPSTVQLPWSEVPGFPLISLRRDPLDHGEPRKQWVICSTSLGEYATGLSNGATLFNMALLDALDGVASDTSSPQWPVRPGVLVDKIDRILGLHRLPGERAQTPAGRMAGSFEITFPGETEKVPVYISLEDAANWPGSTITVTVDDTPHERIVGAVGESPFHKCLVPELATVYVSAENGDSSLGELKAKARAPAIFLEIDQNPSPSVTRIEPLPDAGDAARKARMVIQIQSPMSVRSGAVAKIFSHDKRVSVKEVSVDLGGSVTTDFEPGGCTVALRTPDGRVQLRDVELLADAVVKVDFATQQSPHEWMESAAIIGAIRAPSVEDISPADAAQAAVPFHITEGTLAEPWRAAIERARARVPESKVSIQIVGGVAVDLSTKDSSDLNMQIIDGPDDGRFARFDIDDLTPSRFVAWMSPSIPPVFALISTAGGRAELAAVPSLGNAGAHTVGGWRPYLLIDRKSTNTERLTSVIVEDRKWASLLGYLASRDIAMGVRLLNRGLSTVAIDALGDKRSNPLAAVAGALIAVAASNPDIEKIWDPWLENLAQWFMDLPDGPIVLARRLLMRARSEADVARARSWFEEGFRRGVPVYSLSVDWLARGLDALPGEDQALEDLRKSARILRNRVDPTHTFTVIRLSR
jgi:hypothetical protein